MPADSLTLGKNKRLTRAAEFSHIREVGTVHRGARLTIAFVIEKQILGFRAGFITSRKVGNAVARNRLRRRLREIVRKHQQRLKQGTWLITIAHPAAARAAFGELEDEWLRLAERASILARS